MGKHDVIHASDLNDEQLTFENLRYLYVPVDPILFPDPGNTARWATVWVSKLN